MWAAGSFLTLGKTWGPSWTGQRCITETGNTQIYTCVHRDETVHPKKMTQHLLLRINHWSHFSMSSQLSLLVGCVPRPPSPPSCPLLSISLSVLDHQLSRDFCLPPTVGISFQMFIDLFSLPVFFFFSFLLYVWIVCMSFGFLLSVFFLGLHGGERSCSSGFICWWHLEVVLFTPISNLWFVTVGYIKCNVLTN